MDPSQYGYWQRRYGNWLADSLQWRGEDVLDIGCNCGNIVAGLSENEVHAAGIDINEHAINLGRLYWRSGDWQQARDLQPLPNADHPPLVLGDAVNMHQFRDQQFQGLHTHHCPQYWRPELVPATLAEIWRVAQPDSLFFGILETSESLGRRDPARKTDDPNWRCIRPLNWWFEQLENAGWTLCREDYRMALMSHDRTPMHSNDWDWWLARKVSRHKITSKFCVRDDFDRPQHAEWVHNLKLSGKLLRKEWEHSHIAAALDERGLLQPKSYGLGFGVGREPLVSAFAARGCQIMATDLPNESWNIDSQWSNQLNSRQLCPNAEFQIRVHVRHLDMNEIENCQNGHPAEANGSTKIVSTNGHRPPLTLNPIGLQGRNGFRRLRSRIPLILKDYDFAWSACSLDHLGSLWLSQRFILNAMNCVKPGGWCVHTAEYSLDPRAPTTGKTVYFTDSSLRELIDCLQSLGHHVERFDLNLGNHWEDHHVDIDPFPGPHLKLVAEEGVVATSVILIIQRGNVDDLYFPRDETDGRKLMLS